MKEKGTIIAIDNLGRIVVPSGIRKSLGITPDVPLELFLEKDGIVIKKHSVGCVFCGNTDLVITFMDKPVCRECIDRLAEQ